MNSQAKKDLSQSQTTAIPKLNLKKGGKKRRKRPDITCVTTVKDESHISGTLKAAQWNFSFCVDFVFHLMLGYNLIYLFIYFCYYYLFIYLFSHIFLSMVNTILPPTSFTQKTHPTTQTHTCAHTHTHI